jgi:hypothetical protein
MILHDKPLRDGFMHAMAELQSYCRQQGIDASGLCHIRLSEL